MNITLSQVTGQSSEHWETINEFFLNPERFSNSHNISVIIDKINENTEYMYSDTQIRKERIQALWVIAITLFVYGWDNVYNRQRVLKILQEWEIDPSIFDELQDTAETYNMISNENDAKDIQKSIQDLIELG